MITTILIFTICLLPARFLFLKRAKKQGVKPACTSKYVSLGRLLKNIEVYDGTPKGQQRLEDNV